MAQKKTSAAKTPAKKKAPKKAYFDGVLVVNKKDVKDKEGNDMIKVGLIDGTAKKVPPELFRRKVSYK